jgi:DNA-directed RNA polymerase I, II, and III subunit RPABC2
MVHSAKLILNRDDQVFDEEVIDYDNLDAEDGDDGENGGGAANGDDQNIEADNIVMSGDPSAAAARKSKNTVLELKEKKIPNEKRSTTPYMTKYERARVLGTRALQIRFDTRWS